MIETITGPARRACVALALLFLVLCVPAQAQDDAERNQTRERLRATLTAYGPDLGMTFRQSDRQPYNFVATLTRSLKNEESFEVVVSVTKSNTIGFRAYPHVNGGYINTQKSRDGVGLMNKLLFFTDQNFLFWGADDTHDIFAGYTITLESGYPDAAIRIVLRSIPLLDQFVGGLRPFFDGTAGA
jgi:hypothetical protein